MPATKSFKQKSNIFIIIFGVISVAVFSVLAAKAFAGAKDAQAKSFMSAIPKSALFHIEQFGNYDRFCEQLAQGTYQSTLDVEDYRCGNGKNWYKVGARLSDNTQLCVYNVIGSDIILTCD